MGIAPLSPPCIPRWPFHTKQSTTSRICNNFVRYCFLIPLPQQHNHTDHSVYVCTTSIYAHSQTENILIFIEWCWRYFSPQLLAAILLFLAMLPLSTHSQIGATFSKTILFHKWIPLSITYRPLKGLGPIVQHGLKNRQWNFFPSQILYLTVKKFQPKGRFCIWVRFRKWRMKNFKPRADFAPPTKIAFYTCQKPSHLRPSPAILKSATFSIITNTVRKFSAVTCMNLM